jgi:hypothetical protein
MLADLKPILAKYNCIITFNDDIVNVGAYNYIKSTATITSLNTNETISTTAFAREDETKTGMSAGQMTGCGSSYSRKYALCGLCAVNEEKDLDAIDNRPKPSIIIPKVQPSKFAPHNNNHKEETIDNLELEDNRQPIAVIQPTQQEKAPAEQLKEWFETQNQNDPIISRFYNYWYNRLVEQGWKGKFELNGLIAKFCK